jgi:hypothetical protein
MRSALFGLLFAAIGTSPAYAQLAPPSPSSQPSPLGGDPGSQSVPLSGDQGPQGLDTRDFERAEPVPEPPEPYDPMTDQGGDDPTRPQPQAPVPNPMPPPNTEPPMGVDPEGNVVPLDQVPEVPEPPGTADDLPENVPENLPDGMPENLPGEGPDGALDYEQGRPDPVRD